jgi:hypothetical protein
VKTIQEVIIIIQQGQTIRLGLKDIPALVALLKEYVSCVSTTVMKLYHLALVDKVDEPEVEDG